MPEVYVATYLRSPGDGWPFDLGDDPAFSASDRLRNDGGRLSWGVCRTDLRNAVEPGDVVAFFAADRLQDRRPARYWFVGFATVDRSISQTAIWTDDEFYVYRQYSNLLIEPEDGGCFLHHEPIARSLWHKDWLWRIAERRGHRKRDFDPLEATDRFESGSRVRRRPMRIAANYVLFEPEDEGTFVAAEPPEVAHVSQTGSVEEWHQDELSIGLRELVFSHTRRRGLRTRNRQQPHRHIHLTVDAVPFKDAARALVHMRHIQPRPLTGA